MSTCNCKSFCRCEHKYTLCGTIGGRNHITVPCPKDSKGCDIAVASSNLTIWCKCCPIKILEFDNPLNADDCKRCYLDVDFDNLDSQLLAGLTLAGIQSSECNFKYRLTINDMPYMKGIFTFDFGFV